MSSNAGTSNFTLCVNRSHHLGWGTAGSAYQTYTENKTHPSIPSPSAEFSFRELAAQPK